MQVVVNFTPRHMDVLQVKDSSEAPHVDDEFFRAHTSPEIKEEIMKICEKVNFHFNVRPEHFLLTYALAGFVHVDFIAPGMYSRPYSPDDILRAIADRAVSGVYVEWYTTAYDFFETAEFIENGEEWIDEKRLPKLKETARKLKRKIASLRLLKNVEVLKDIEKTDALFVLDTPTKATVELSAVPQHLQRHIELILKTNGFWTEKAEMAVTLTPTKEWVDTFTGFAGRFDVLYCGKSIMHGTFFVNPASESQSEKERITIKNVRIMMLPENVRNMLLTIADYLKNKEKAHIIARLL